MRNLSAEQKKTVLSVVVPIQLALALLAWRDLSRRTDCQVRVSKRFWRIFVLLNPGNALLYWLFGRRGPAAD